MFEDKHGPKGLEQLNEILRGYPGSGSLELLLCLADGRQVSCQCQKTKIDVNPQMRSRIDELVGPENVRLLTAPLAKRNQNGAKPRGPHYNKQSQTQ